MTSELNCAPTSRNTLGKAAELLGIHRNTLRNYIKKGYIKTHTRKTTGQTIIFGTDMLKFFNECRRSF